MTETYYKPNDIRFSRLQIEWLIPYLSMLRDGMYPRDSRESGYTEAAINKRQVKSKAGFINPAEIAAELDWRICQTGLDGLFFEMVYSCEREDRIFAMQHIATALKVDINQVSKWVYQVLSYISGYKRKGRSYYQWRNHLKGQ